VDGVWRVSEFDNDVERKELRPDHILIIDAGQWHFTVNTFKLYNEMNN
jgi:hypothetical protein